MMELICRGAIRKHLLRVYGPTNVSFRTRIPQLPVSVPLQKFLMYNIPLHQTEPNLQQKEAKEAEKDNKSGAIETEEDKDTPVSCSFCFLLWKGILILVGSRSS